MSTQWASQVAPDIDVLSESLQAAFSKAKINVRGLSAAALPPAGLCVPASQPGARHTRPPPPSHPARTFPPPTCNNPTAAVGERKAAENHAACAVGAQRNGGRRNEKVWKAHDATRAPCMSGRPSSKNTLRNFLFSAEKHAARGD